MNPVTAENMGESMSLAIYIMLAQFDILHCQNNTKEDKGKSMICAVASEKAYLGM